ncbi:Na+/H+ antiporter NhaC [Cytobacillus sp. S13-E01]|uniref:Na+/H+ antiporter NhaC n=1 Tax=Cytobacillus sp. S13-E01 TaxID=3031326 RepID=UPI0023D898C5|nr:Na+/H+ antiporter NhaC [Cytobacillus sp. S13-E01]MDF0725833.1 Na+/H+ antiporter NhaC [Cytobacillus sp. S13-E01]
MKNLRSTEAFLLTFVVLTMIGVAIIKFDAPPQVPIFFSIILLIGFGLFKKISWSSMEQGIRNSVSSGIIPIIIFLLIGILISVWIESGTIPTLIVIGFQFVSEEYLLLSAFVITAIVGTSIGSAFTTASTVGVAFMAIGQAMGINPAWIAGAIVSGSYFGDKMSPLSDTTNLAPTVCKVDLFEHIRNMLWTTIPAFLISVVFYFLLGNRIDEVKLNRNSFSFVTELDQVAVVHWFALLPMIVMIFFAIRKTPAIPTILSGIVTGIIMIYLFQPQTSIEYLMNIIQNGSTVNTDNEQMAALLNRGGIQSMMWSVSLILLTLTMGGLLSILGIIERLVESMRNFVATTGRLVLSSALTAIGINIVIGEQYMSIILTGNAFVQTYEKLGLKRKTLSRVLEDAGTVVNPLIPYGISGVFLTSVLGVNTIDYLWFAVFCLLCPVLTIIYGFTGIGIEKEKSFK